MKEPKFKAWNKKDESMYDVLSIEFLAGGLRIEGTGVHIGNGWATCNKGYDHECDVVLREYAGFKDQSGSDVFDGDIVESDYYMPEHKAKTVVEVIEEDGVQRIGFRGHEQDAFKYGNLMVIGNIYENPELI